MQDRKLRIAFYAHAGQPSQTLIALVLKIGNKAKFRRSSYWHNTADQQETRPTCTQSLHNAGIKDAPSFMTDAYCRPIHVLSGSSYISRSLGQPRYAPPRIPPSSSRRHNLNVCTDMGAKFGKFSRRQKLLAL
jgi:hypothetical protein